MRDYQTLRYYLFGAISLEEAKEQMEDIRLFTDSKWMPYEDFNQQMDAVVEYMEIILDAQVKKRDEIADRIETFLINIHSDEVFMHLAKKVIKNEQILKHLNVSQTLLNRFKKLA